MIEQCIVSGGRSVVVRNAGAELNAGMVVCPACKTQCAAGAKFCNNCGAKLENKCPSAGRRYRPEAASAEHAEHRFPRRALRCDKGRRLRMRREKTAGAAKAGTGSPQTGDSSDMALWIGLMLASCGGVLGMLFYRRKKAAAGK